MHPQVEQWVFAAFHQWRKDKQNLSVLEIGSLDINGSIKKTFEPFSSEYVGIDVQEGPGVDIVSPGESYWAPEKFDVIVTCETFEHTDKWQEIIKQSWINLKHDGIFIATMAGEGRPPHSALDEKPIREWEYYANVGAWALNKALFMFKLKQVNVQNTDTRCWAIK